MKHQIGHRIAVLALAALLGACGGSGGGAKEEVAQPVQPSQPEPPAATSEYAGHVADENGAPVSGISIRLENRTTDEITETVSAPDGSFSAVVEPGVYDILFDDTDAVQYVSVQKTSVDLRESQAAQVALPSAAPEAKNLLKSTVTYQDGTRAAHRQVLIEPSITRSSASATVVEVPDPILVETDAQGTFSQPLGTAGMDIDFDVKIIAVNAPKLDMEKLAFNYQFLSQHANATFPEVLKDYTSKYAEESINIRKPDGPMQLELAIGSPVRNLRSATGTSNGIPEDERRLVVYTGEHGSENSPAATPPAAVVVTPGNQFNLLREINPADGTLQAGRFFGGKLDVSANCGYRTFKEITAPASGTFDTEYSRGTSICVTPTQYSKPLFTHKVLVKTDRKSEYKFTDESGDVYSLKIMQPTLGEAHVVRYRSKAPAIKSIAFKLPPASLD